tara:strand:- start:94 stop:291 length:198 start_codon:yes stop_codon:yes gene_type:complete
LSVGFQWTAKRVSKDDKMYKIMGTYRGNSEELDEADTLDEANYLLTEYRVAFGPDWLIEIVPTSK